MNMSLTERLAFIWRCRRCECLSCDRGGAGELHDHVCTDGPHCLETRDKLRARRMAEAQTALDAFNEIERLTKLVEELQQKEPKIEKPKLEPTPPPIDRRIKL